MWDIELTIRLECTVKPFNHIHNPMAYTEYMYSVRYVDLNLHMASDYAMFCLGLLSKRAPEETHLSLQIPCWFQRRYDGFHATTCSWNLLSILLLMYKRWSGPNEVLKIAGAGWCTLFITFDDHFNYGVWVLIQRWYVLRQLFHPPVPFWVSRLRFKSTASFLCCVTRRQVSCMIDISERLMVPIHWLGLFKFIMLPLSFMAEFDHLWLLYLIGCLCLFAWILIFRLWFALTLFIMRPAE